MHRAGLALTVSGLLFFAPGALAQEGTAGEIASWIAQLGSDEIAVREAATTRLIERGVAALDGLGATPPPKDPEIRARLDQILQDILRTHVRSFGDPRRSTEVTIDLKDVPAHRVVEAFARQVPLKIELNERNLSREDVLNEVRLSRMPFPQAFDAFLKQAGLRLVREGPDEIRVERPPRLTFAFTEARVSVVLDMLERVSGVALDLTGENLGSVTIACDNEPWDVFLDRLAAQIGVVAISGSDGRVAIRRPGDFQKQVETWTFPLKHLRPGRPAAGKADPFANLLLRLGFQLTRGASWKTVHGRLEYDPRTHSLKATDREEVLRVIRKTVEPSDQPSGK